MDFFIQPPGSLIQDGTHDHSPQGEWAYTDLPDADAYSILPQDNSSDPSASSDLSSTPNSPAKSWMRMHADTQASEVRPALENLLIQTPVSSPISAFPTSNQPIIDTMLKEMLIYLHSSLHNDISSMFSAFKSEMICMRNKVGRIEQQLGTVTETVNDLVDAHDYTREEHQWMQAKMADLEDRFNNVKIRGIPETVLPADLNSYARKLISSLLPDLPPVETIIDRIHCLPKPPHLPAGLPHDTLIRIHFFHTKDMLLATTRRLDLLPPPYSKLQLFADFSQYTANSSSNFRPSPNL